MIYININLILLALLGLIVVISAVVGLIRGLNKSVVRLMLMVLAVLLTFAIAGPISKVIGNNIIIEGQSLGQMLLSNIRTEEMVARILDAAPLMEEAILVLPAFGVAILLFPVVFCLLSFISWIVFLFVQKPLRRLIFKDSCKKEDYAAQSKGARVGKRFAGMGVGIATGLLIFAMLMVPTCGLLSMLPSPDAVQEMVDPMVEQEMLYQSDADLIMQFYSSTDTGILKALKTFGVGATGKAYLNGVSKIKADGQTTRLGDEIDSLFTVAQTAMEGGLINALVVSEDEEALLTVLSDKVFVNQLMQDMFQSKLLRSAAPELTAIAMEAMVESMDVPSNVAGSVLEDIRQTLTSALGDDETAMETADALANIVSDLLVVLSTATDENGEISLENLDFGTIGNIVTQLQESPLKDLGTALLDLVLNSELAEDEMVSDLLEAVKDGYAEGEDVGGVINTAGDLINIGAALNGDREENQDVLADSFTSLINNLNDYTLELLPSILSDSTLTAMGIPAELTDATYAVAETLLTELVQLQGAADYTSEVNAILHLYDLATSGKTFTDEDIPELVEYATESDAIYNTILTLSESNPFDIEIPDEATRTQLIDGIEEFYAQSGKTPRERNLYYAVAVLLGLEADVTLA